MVRRTTFVVLSLAWVFGASAQIDAPAQYRLGRSLYESSAGPEDDAKAVALFEAAARTGYAPAQFMMGFHLMRPETVDLPKARDWLQKAAEQREACAMQSLGNLARRGLHPDRVAAAAWLRLAAAYSPSEIDCGLNELPKATKDFEAKMTTAERVNAKQRVDAFIAAHPVGKK